MKHANVLKHPVFYAIPVVFGLFIYMLFQSGIIRGDLFGTEKLSKEIAHRSNAPKKVTKTPTELNPYSEHTPNIYRTYSATGQTLFTNRIKNKQSTQKDEQ
ncbi:MAG: hypothetical protein D3906_15960 [Candidatus Electrothrix sp. AUS1_2]|nr:hypothetical protein [Candidatus Electrothrix sp. AUS1_2]